MTRKKYYKLVPMIFLVMTMLSVFIFGCSDRDSTISSPVKDSIVGDKRCPPIEVTYEDPITTNPELSGGIKDFTLVKTSTEYHLFHITDPNPGWTGGYEIEFGHATSENLFSWETGDRIDYLRDLPDGWSSSFIWAPHVIHNDNLYYMFYTGVKLVDPNHNYTIVQQVGLATSSDPDLDDWDLHNGDGLLLPGPHHDIFEWSAYGINPKILRYSNDCRDPFVFDRGDGVIDQRYVMLNSIRLYNDTPQNPWDTEMAIAYATSDDLVNWTWKDYYAVTVGGKAESANIVYYNDYYYLMWTNHYDADAVQIAYSESIFGRYAFTQTNDSDSLFGLGNETLFETERTLYAAFDDDYVLHFMKEIEFPEVPGPSSPIYLWPFTECDDPDYDPYNPP